MKTTRAIVTALAATALLAAGSGLFACKKKEPETIKIGAILPLTGDYAVYGKKMKNAIDLALKLRDDNENSLYRFEILYEDDQGDPKTAVTAFNKLTADPEIQVVIGGIASALAQPLAPLTKEKKVILFSPGASAPTLSGVSPYFIRNWPSDDYEGVLMADIARERLNIGKVAILYVNNDWGNGLSKVFKNEFESHRGVVTDFESFEEGTTDVRTQLLKLKATRPEALYCPGYIKELLVIIRQMAEVDFKPEFLGSSGLYDPQIIKVGGEAIEGAVFPITAYDAENPTPEIRNFVDSYEKDYGEKPDVWAAQAFDAVNIIFDAFEAGNRDAKTIRGYILGVKNYPGISGTTTFKSNGDVEKRLRIMTVINGEFEDFSE